MREGSISKNRKPSLTKLFGARVSAKKLRGVLSSSYLLTDCKHDTIVSTVTPDVTVKK
jgi:hypothetical protein